MIYLENLVTKEIIENFLPVKNIKNISHYGAGHINKTLKVDMFDGDSYILQGVNKKIFPHPEYIIQNILELKESSSEKNIILFPLATKEGKYFIDDEKYSWRIFPFAKGYRTFQKAHTKQIARIVGKGYSDFIATYKDINPRKLKTIIDDFHNIEKRYDSLIDAANHPQDEKRGQYCADLLDFINFIYPQLQALHKKIESGEIPMRVTHNDTKINNILIGENFEDFVVIDLDTVMGGSLLYDFGDMCRSACNLGDEDDENEENIIFSLEIFSGLCEGYSQNKHIITSSEKENLFLSLLYMSAMLSMRFLDDFLRGDIYFKIKNPYDNYVRAKNQILLYQDIVKKETKIQGILDKNF